MKGCKRCLKSLFVACLLIFNNLEFSNCKDSNNTKIIIIGSGPAGIAAAAKLMENGFNNVTILEAEDRIGGRVYTTKFGNYSIDIGGQWIHGEVGNIAFQLANPYGLVDASHEPDSGIVEKYVESSGNFVDANVNTKIHEFFIDHAYNGDSEQNSTQSTHRSVGEYVDKKYDEVFKDDPAILNQKKKYLDQMELLRLESDSAETWNDVSAQGLLNYKTCEGDQTVNWKERGYSTILDIVLKRYPNPENEIPVVNNTMLNAEVTSIDYSNNTEGPSILITTASGKTFKADHVIVTVSLGVLKDKHKSLFKPQLPDYKVNAIESTGFGAVAKIFMLFEKPFWILPENSRILHFSFLWDEEERKKIEADPEKKWLLGMPAAMTVESKPQLLTLWVTGKHVKDMEALPEEKVFSHSVENLQRFLGKTYNISTPLAMMRSRWFSNPHFKGTYSYRSVESDDRQVFPEMLERPLDENTLRVLFAGEATETERSATVDGAIKSGWKAADRLIDHYTKASKSLSAQGA